MNILAAVLLLAAASAAAAEHVLEPSFAPSQAYTLVSDRPPVATPSGFPALPAGTTLTVNARGGGLFVVGLVAPYGSAQSAHRRSWSRRLTAPGGYTLQYGSEKAETLSQLHFVVVSATAGVAGGPSLP